MFMSRNSDLQTRRNHEHNRRGFPKMFRREDNSKEEEKDENRLIN